MAYATNEFETGRHRLRLGSMQATARNAEERPGGQPVAQTRARTPRVRPTVSRQGLQSQVVSRQGQSQGRSRQGQSQGRSPTGRLQQGGARPILRSLR